MAIEIKGKVLRFGKVKDYGQPTNWGRDFIHIYKFFLKVESKEHGEVLAMVECKAEASSYGLRIPEDAERQRPLVGDTVKFTTHRLKENDDGTKWASITWNQTYEIVKKSKKAQKDKEAWIQKKKEEDEKRREQVKEENKQKSLEAELLRLGERETEKYDERIPEEVKELMSSSFTWQTIQSLLRDTTWFVTPEGEGGKQAVYSLSGVILEDGYAGTGLRRPNGCLYQKPKTVRQSILKKALQSGLITETEKGYKATEKGIKTLIKIDTCPVCGELRQPMHEIGHYSTPQWSRTDDWGISYHCKHELREIYKSQQGCNVGSTYRDLKKTPEKLAEILKYKED